MSEQPITTGGAAKLLNISPDRVRQLERLGTLAAQRTETGIRLFSRAQVERVAEARRQERRGR